MYVCMYPWPFWLRGGAGARTPRPRRDAFSPLRVCRGVCSGTAVGRGAMAVVASADDDHIVARVKIIKDPGHYMNHKASHLVDARSVEYWASLAGQVPAM